MSKEKSNALHRDINGQMKLCIKLAHVHEMLLVWGRVCEFRSAYYECSDMRHEEFLSDQDVHGYWVPGRVEFTRHVNSEHVQNLEF